MDPGVSSKPRTSFEFEVQEILDVSSDGNYQVQWAPAWVSKFHLVGCENLIQEFLQRQQTDRTIKVEPLTIKHHKDDVKVSPLTHSDEMSRLSGKECDRNLDAVQQPQTSEEHSTNPLSFDMQGMGNPPVCLEKNVDSSLISINDSGHNDATHFKKTICSMNSSLSYGKPVMDDLHDHCTSSIDKKTDSPLVPVKDVTSQQDSGIQSTNEEQDIDRAPLNICDVTYWSSLSAVPCVAQINLSQCPTIQQDIHTNSASNTKGPTKDVGPLTYVLKPDTQLEHPPIDFATTGFEQSIVPVNSTLPCNKQDNSGIHDPSSHVNHKANSPLVPILDELSEQHFVPQSTNEQQESCDKGPLNRSKDDDCSPLSTVTSFEQPDQSQSTLHGASIQQGCPGESASNISEKDNKTEADHKILEEHSQNPTSQLGFDDQDNAVACVTGNPGNLSLKRIGKKLPSTDERRFECSHCSKKFTSKTGLLIHFRIHSGDRPYKCELCDYTCVQKGHLASHMHVHTNTRPRKKKRFECSRCPQKFISHASLLIHLHIHSGDRPFKCELCDYTGVSKGYLTSHMNVHTNKKPHTCDTCGKSFSLKQNLKTHMRIHTRNRPYVCQVCEKSFIQLSALNCHRNNVHRADKDAKRGKENLEEDVESPSISTVESDFNNDTTDFDQSSVAMHNSMSFNKQVNMGIHDPSSNVNHRASSSLLPVLDELTQQNSVPQCTNEQQETCDKSPLASASNITGKDAQHIAVAGTTSNSGNLSLKRLGKSPLNDKRQFECSHCSKKFTAQSSLRLHIRIHTGDRLYKCEICDYKCARKAHLASHMHVHTNTRPRKKKCFECSQCPKKFISQASLLIHKRIHSGDRPFKCKLCDYTCVQKGHLVSHMHVHTGKKPHTCSYCGKSFSQKQNLNTHMRIHTGQRPYVCEVCEKSFIQLSSLNSHRNRVHRAVKDASREKET